MQFSGKQAEIFQNACDEYERILDLLIRECIFHEEEVNQEVMLRIDFTIQKMLIVIATADKNISEEEHQFILSVCNHVEIQNEKNAGFKRFLKYFTVENADVGIRKYFFKYSFADTEKYFINNYFQINASQNWEYIKNRIISICKAMIKINGNISCAKNDCLTSMLKGINDVNITSDENKSQTLLENNKRLDIAIESLNNLIGLASVKKEVGKRIDLIKFNKKIKELNGEKTETSTLSLHMAFTGAPGTGKSTVALLIGKIYKELGVLSKGHLVKVGRDDIIQEYEGQTAKNMARIIRSAKGGILFIDEAYALVESNIGANFGQEAIDTLVKYMEELRDDLIVIVAGYDEEMNRFVKSNKGLPSRFRKYIHFDNYTAEEMLDIFENICKNTPEKMNLDPMCRPILLKYFSNFVGDVTFANGRGVRNTFEEMHEAHASRIVRLGLESKEEIRTYTLDDLKEIIPEK
mgnify:CR=1 FL=1